MLDIAFRGWRGHEHNLGGAQAGSTTANAIAYKPFEPKGTGLVKPALDHSQEVNVWYSSRLTER
jgi:hypothetical protein